MRIARVEGPDGRPVAAVVADDLVHLAPGEDPVQLLRDAVDSGRSAMTTALGVSGAPGIPLSDVRLLAPLEPATIRDFVAFEEHVEGVARSVDRATAVSPVVPEWYGAPAF